MTTTSLDLKAFTKNIIWQSRTRALFEFKPTLRLFRFQGTKARLVPWPWTYILVSKAKSQSYYEDMYSLTMSRVNFAPAPIKTRADILYRPWIPNQYAMDKPCIFGSFGVLWQTNSGQSDAELINELIMLFFDNTYNGDNLSRLLNNKTWKYMFNKSEATVNSRFGIPKILDYWASLTTKQVVKIPINHWVPAGTVGNMLGLKNKEGAL